MRACPRGQSRIPGVGVHLDSPPPMSAPTLGHALRLPHSTGRKAPLGDPGLPLILLSRRWRDPFPMRAFGLQVQCSLPQASRCHIHEVTAPRSLPVQRPEVPGQLRALVTLEDRAHCQRAAHHLKLFSFSLTRFSFVALEWPTFHVHFKFESLLAEGSKCPRQTAPGRDCHPQKHRSAEETGRLAAVNGRTFP